MKTLAPELVRGLTEKLEAGVKVRTSGHEHHLATELITKLSKLPFFAQLVVHFQRVETIAEFFVRKEFECVEHRVWLDGHVDLQKSSNNEQASAEDLCVHAE